MPWWAWLLVDLFVVLAALGVVAVTGLHFYRTLRGFLSRMSAVLSDLPRIERPR